MATKTTPTTPTYKPTVRHLSGTRYDVQSRTRPERVHHVDTYHLTCSCEAASFGKRCWALAVALQFEAWRRHEEAKAQAERLAARQAAAALPGVVHPNGADFHKTAGYQGLAECF